MKSNDIIIDDFVYARAAKSNKNIQVLVDKLKAGIDLDPVIYQMVTGYNDMEDNVPILINGGHRLEAYDQYNSWAKKQNDITKGENKPLLKFEIKKPPLQEASSAPLDYETSKTKMAILAHNTNDSQGLNSRPEDTKKIARNICLDNETWTLDQIASALNRNKSTISPYISDILQQRRATTKSLAIRLSCLGWTQKEIGKVVDRGQDTVSKIMKKFDAKQIHNFHSDGKTVEEIASILNIDIQTVWHYLLKDKTDDEKFKALDEATEGNINACPMDVMNYNNCLPLMGDGVYDGRIPGQIVWNMLYFFTKPGDLVLDPMVGGGTTIDACLIMNRKCIGYDKAPSRDDIKKHDITDDPPNERAQLIFYDPPYFRKKEDEYGLPEALRTKEGFLAFAANWVGFAKKALSPGGYVALLISDYIDYEHPAGSIFSDEYASLFAENGFDRIYKFSYPLTANQYQPHDMDRARKKKNILIRGRELHLMRKKQ
ncbi:MAG: DNA methyltransferase [Candidatus Thorarchaeota archaeon]|jgi:K+/H+ antiporter YhaU regulatory subunit KhtT